jgi:hypothetical protein
MTFRILCERFAVIVAGCVAILITSADSGAADAGWNPDPSANTPICTAAADQDYPLIAPDGHGGAYVAWQDPRNPDGSQAVFSRPGLYVQHISSSGKRLWQQDGIPATLDQVYGDRTVIAADGHGGLYLALVALRSGAGAVCVQRLSAQGERLFGNTGRTVATPGTIVRGLSAASDGAGGMLLLWDAEFDFKVYSQRVGPNGDLLWPTDFQPSTETTQQYTMDIVPTVHGGAVAVLTTYHDAPVPWGAVAQRISPSGNREWGDEGVPVFLTPMQTSSSHVVGDEAGGVYVLNDNYVGPAFNNFQVLGQHVDANGDRLWGDSGKVLSPASAKLAMGNTGLQPDSRHGLIMALTNYEYPDGALVVNRVSPDGTLLWGNGTLVWNAGAELHTFTHVSDGTGGTIAAWSYVARSNFDLDLEVFAQHVDKNGTPLWHTNGVNVSTSRGDEDAPVITSAGKHGAIVAWTDRRTIPSQSDILAEKLPSKGPKRPNLVGEPYSQGIVPPVSVNCPADVSQPCDLTISFRVTNTGSRPSATREQRRLQNVKARIVLSDNKDPDDFDVPLGTQTLQPLAPGKAQVYQLNLSIPAGVQPSGKYVLVSLDADYVVSELSEIDNFIVVGRLP